MAHGDTREAILQIVVEHVAEYGWVPSNGEIATRVGITRTCVQRHLTELGHRGVLSLRSDQSGSRLLNTPEGRIARWVTKILLTKEQDACDMAEEIGFPRWVGTVLRNLVKHACSIHHATHSPENAKMGSREHLAGSRTEA